MRTTVTTEYNFILAEPRVIIPGKRIDARMPEVYAVLVGRIVKNLDALDVCYDGEKSNVVVTAMAGTQGGDSNPQCTQPLRDFLKEEEITPHATTQYPGRPTRLRLIPIGTPRHRMTAEIDLEMRMSPSGKSEGVMDLTIKTAYSAQSVKDAILRSISAAYYGIELTKHTHVQR